MCHLPEGQWLRTHRTAPATAAYADTVKIPIACSLTDSAATSQIGEWQAVLAATTVAHQRLSPTELSLELRDDLAQLEEIVRLAQREKACCPFFDFALRIEADAISLTISVPADAASLLDHFAQPHR